MKKIVLAVNSLRGNGAERFVLTMAKTFMAMGCDVHVVLFKRHIQLPLPRGLKIHVFDYHPFRALPKIIRLPLVSKLLDRSIQQDCGTPDLVLSNSFYTDWVLASSKLPNVHMVVHNTLSQSVGNGTRGARQLSELRAIYRKKPAVAVGDGVYKDFQEIFPTCRIVRIHNPVDRDWILDQAHGETSGIPARFIVHVGKFKQAKRHDVLLQAYACSGVDAPLLLLGEGELMAPMKALAETLGIADRVIFKGFCANPYPYLQQASLMVMSSDFEGFSIAMLEALVLGTPLISTDCPSGPNEILPPRNLVPVQAVDQLAMKIRDAITNPESYRIPFDPKFLPSAAANAYLDLV